MNIEDKFRSMIYDFSFGLVEVVDNYYSINFRTKIDGVTYETENSKNSPLLEINDSKEFFDVLNEYIQVALPKSKYEDFTEEEKVDCLLVFLFVNATTDDFKNPIQYIKRRIEFYKDNTFDEFEMKLDIQNKNDQYTLTVSNEREYPNMECPNIMAFRMTNAQGETINLPTIEYAICDNECYIYSIMNHESLQKSKFKKDINRLVMKLNNGVLDSESEEYKDYKQKLDELIKRSVDGTISVDELQQSYASLYYPDNISDVTPSFVYSLAIFIQILASKEIEKLHVIPYLPIRYLSNLESTTDDLKPELKEKQTDIIQSNITEKLIRTFERAVYHIDGLEITSYPYDVDSTLSLRISSNLRVNNELIDINKHLK